MATTTIEQASGELVGEKKTHRVQLRLTVKELWADESAQPVDRAIAKVEPLSLSGVEDGAYTLRFSFDGKPEEQAVQVKFGFMLAI